MAVPARKQRSAVKIHDVANPRVVYLVEASSEACKRGVPYRLGWSNPRPRNFGKLVERQPPGQDTEPILARGPGQDRLLASATAKRM